MPKTFNFQKKQSMKQDTKETIGPRGTVAGFRPLIGEERWHRGDFTAGMLEGGWRPLIDGEETPDGDEALHGITSGWFTIRNCNEPANSTTTPCRTRRPLPPPQVETFEAHGHVWYRHVPGEACPVDLDVVVDCIYESEIKRSFKTCPDPASNWDWSVDEDCPGYDIIGYRFPDFPAVHAPLQQEQSDVQQQFRTKQRLATMYHGWCDVAPDSVAECIADVARVLYPTDAERCEAAFEAWLDQRGHPGMDVGAASEAWDAAWSAAKQEKL